MITQNDIIADLHTHTIFSKHAYSTIQENIVAAQKMNLKYLAVTDHIYNDGTENEIKNEATRCKYMEKEVNAHREAGEPYVIGGAEFNIAQELNHRSWKKLKKLKWRPIGLHGFNLKVKQLSLNVLYEEFEKASKAHNAFAHIERELHKIDGKRYGKNLHDDIKEFLQSVVELAKDKEIFLELNESSMRNNEDNNLERIKYWLPLAKANGCRIYLASDAHYCTRIGKFPLAIELLNDLDYPRELILNCNETQLEEIVNTQN